MRTPFRGPSHLAFAASLMILAACGGSQAPAPAPSAAAPAPAPAATAAAPATDAAAAPATDAAAAPATDAAAAPAAAPSQAAIDEAAQIYATRCTPCHGVDGKGDGLAAASLNPKPRNYQDAAWQATVKDEEIEKAILLGGAGVGKSLLMPANPDLATKPEVITALRMKVRSFAAPAATPAP